MQSCKKVVLKRLKILYGDLFQFFYNNNKTLCKYVLKERTEKEFRLLRRYLYKDITSMVTKRIMNELPENTVKLGYNELGYNELGYNAHSVITNKHLFWLV